MKMNSIVATTLFLSFVAGTTSAQWVEPEWDDYDCVIKRDELLQTVAPHTPVYLNGDAVCRPYQPRDTKFPDRVRLTDDAPNQAGSAYTTSTFRNTEYFPLRLFSSMKSSLDKTRLLLMASLSSFTSTPMVWMHSAQLVEVSAFTTATLRAPPGESATLLSLKSIPSSTKGPFLHSPQTNMLAPSMSLSPMAKDMQRECTRKIYPSPSPRPIGERCGFHILFVLLIFLTFTSEASIQTQDHPTL